MEFAAGRARAQRSATAVDMLADQCLLTALLSRKVGERTRKAASKGEGSEVFYTLEGCLYQGWSIERDQQLRVVLGMRLCGVPLRYRRPSFIGRNRWDGYCLPVVRLDNVKATI